MLYQFISSLLVFVLVTSVVANDEPQIHLDAANPVYGSMAPPPPVAGDAPSSFCISAEDAAILGRDFGLLISNYTTELAIKLLADEFIDQADSVNTLINNSPLPNQPVRIMLHALSKSIQITD